MLSDVAERGGPSPNHKTPPMGIHRFRSQAPCFLMLWGAGRRGRADQILGRLRDCWFEWVLPDTAAVSTFLQECTVGWLLLNYIAQSEAVCSRMSGLEPG